MLTPILLLSLLHFIHCSCPKGYELARNGECRGFYGTLQLKDDVAESIAVDKCEEVQGRPLIIHDAQDQAYWKIQKAGTSRRRLLGIVCDPISFQWEWMDRSPLDFKPQKPENYSATLDGPCKTNCVWYQDDTGLWKEWCNTDTGPFDVFCAVQLQPPFPGADGCDGFDDDNEDGECYQIGAVAEDWQDAQMSCANLGANLASIHNQQENSFVRRLAVSKGALNGLFLGATMIGKGSDFGWVDGTEWDYENFHQGFPMPGLGDCLAMDTSISTGLWMNMDCTAKLPVACIRDQRPVAVPTCSPGPWKENTIITSPGFPFSASTFCDYFLTVSSGMRVELEIVFIEANSCCDSLVIYDGYLGASVLATVTGEVQNVTYTTTSSNVMRVNWQPNGGVNVRGMAMTFRGV